MIIYCFTWAKRSKSHKKITITIASKAHKIVLIEESLFFIFLAQTILKKHQKVANEFLLTLHEDDS